MMVNVQVTKKKIEDSPIHCGDVVRYWDEEKYFTYGLVTRVEVNGYNQYLYTVRKKDQHWRFGLLLTECDVRCPVTFEIIGDPHDYAIESYLHYNETGRYDDELFKSTTTHYPIIDKIILKQRAIKAIEFCNGLIALNNQLIEVADPNSQNYIDEIKCDNEKLAGYIQKHNNTIAQLSTK